MRMVPGLVSTILFKIITRIKLLCSSFSRDYSYCFRGYFELISITVTVSLICLVECSCRRYFPQEFPRMFCNYTCMLSWFSNLKRSAFEKNGIFWGIQPTVSFCFSWSVLVFFRFLIGFLARTWGLGRICMSFFWLLACSTVSARSLVNHQPGGGCIDVFNFPNIQFVSTWLPTDSNYLGRSVPVSCLFELLEINFGLADPDFVIPSSLHFWKRGNHSFRI